jgi:hypothetical protein
MEEHKGKETAVLEVDTRVGFQSGKARVLPRYRLALDWTELNVLDQRKVRVPLGSGYVEFDIVRGVRAGSEAG